MKVRPSSHPGSARAGSPIANKLLRVGVVFVAGMLLLFVFALLVNPGWIQRGVTAVESRWGQSLYTYDRSLGQKISAVIGSYLREARGLPDIPELVIDVPFKEMRKIYTKREEALERGNLIQGEDDFVRGEIRADGRTIPIKLRLKGDWNDHLSGRKWSFRIHTRRDEQLFGMRRFSIQNPQTRGFQSELMYFEALKRYNIMSPRYSFVNVTLNGEPMGLMALEEFFSKELLEYNRRREGVIVRFDESLAWASRDGYPETNVGWHGAFDDYRNVAIDAFGSARIAESPVLSNQYRIAVGLLRGFVDRRLKASEVFDVNLLGQFLAVSDMFGSWHATAWHNLRFYLNPITLRLEPIAFDATLQDRMEEDESIINDEPLLLHFMEDQEILSVYQRTLLELAELVQSGELEEQLRAKEAQHLPVLRSEFRLVYNFPLDYLAPRIDALLEKFGPDSTTLADEFYFFWKKEEGIYPRSLHLTLLGEGAGQQVEISNAVPRDLEVLELQWVNSESGDSVPVDVTGLPLFVPARGIGSAPQTSRLVVGAAPEGAGWALEASARLPGRAWTQSVQAYRSYEALSVSPISAGSLQELLSRYPFIERAGSSNELLIPAGNWQLTDPLIVPPGYRLRVEAGATLQFSADTVMVVNGALIVVGSRDAPVVFEALDGEGWPGFIVTGASDQSSIEHLIVRSTTGVALNGWALTGGVNFYKSNVDISNTRFENSLGEDALNIIDSRFEIRDTIIEGTASDAFDSDFSEGSVIRSRFVAIGKAGGGDAIDVSGSQITVADSEFEDIQDKALSVGERSEMVARNIRMQNVGTGAASKDGSRLTLNDVQISGAGFAGLTAYIKKPEYGPASIEASNVVIRDAKESVLVQTNSVVELDGELVGTRDVDVDALYETVMRKGPRS